MKYVSFNKLQIKNFLSVGDEPVCIEFNTGLNIITGLNRDKEDRRNGVGKSTIADAVYFAVFGNTIRELKKEHVVNNVTQNKCEVVLNFEINNNNKRDKYKIVRTLGPTKCYLFINDEDKTRDSITNTNELISEIINSSPEVFQNCVIMTINNTTPFMAKKKLDKRKFIEGIFNLQVFSNMLTNARSAVNEINRQFEVECVRYEESSNALDSHNKQQSDMREHQRISRERLNQREQSNSTAIDEYNKKLECLQPIDRTAVQHNMKMLQAAHDKKQQQISELQNKTVSVSTRIDMLNEKHDRAGTKEATCSMCLRPIEDHDKSHIEDEKKQMKKHVDGLENHKQQILQEKYKHETKLNDVNEAIKKLQNKLYKDDLNKQEIKNINNNIKQLQESNKQIDDDIQQLKSDTSGLETIIKETTAKLEDIQKDIDVFKNKLNTYEVIKFIVSEEGVKSYIVKKILQLFNSKLAYYLKKMDANCICVFNEYFEEQIIDEKGKICSYFNFSGAERKNIDLACLFAFMDIRRLQGDVAFNFSVYDELFDSSLDEKGVDLVTEILKERVDKYKECIMVISHRKESMKNATGEIIFLEKKNGITTRIDTPIELTN
jgi:DNA repair exonuclease SbcCD ATPase subunit